MISILFNQKRWSQAGQPRALSLTNYPKAANKATPILYRCPHLQNSLRLSLNRLESWKTRKWLKLLLSSSSWQRWVESQLQLSNWIICFNFPLGAVVLCFIIRYKKLYFKVSSEIFNMFYGWEHSGEHLAYSLIIPQTGQRCLKNERQKHEIHDVSYLTLYIVIMEKLTCFKFIKWLVFFHQCSLHNIIQCVFGFTSVS